MSGTIIVRRKEERTSGRVAGQGGSDFLVLDVVDRAFARLITQTCISTIFQKKTYQTQRLGLLAGGGRGTGTGNGSVKGCRLRLAVDGVHVCPLGEKFLRRSHTPKTNGPMQRCDAILIGFVDADAPLEQKANDPNLHFRIRIVGRTSRQEGPLKLDIFSCHRLQIIQAKFQRCQLKRGHGRISEKRFVGMGR